MQASQKDAFWRAVKSWDQALRAFDQADDDSLTYTIYQLQAAEEQVSIILRQARRASAAATNPSGQPSPAGTSLVTAEASDRASTC